MKINTEISMQQLLRLSEAEIHGLLYPAEANLGYALSAVLLPSSASYGNDVSL